MTAAYRAFPKYILHPKEYPHLSSQVFENTVKKKMESANSVCPGHDKTVVYLVEDAARRYYIVEVRLTKGTYYTKTPCTFTPTFGMDSIDGGFAQDAEEWIIEQHLQLKSSRLMHLFAGQSKISATEYLARVGFPVKLYEEKEDLNVYQVLLPTDQSRTAPSSGKRKWWKFW